MISTSVWNDFESRAQIWLGQFVSCNDSRVHQAVQNLKCHLARGSANPELRQRVIYDMESFAKLARESMFKRSHCDNNNNNGACTIQNSNHNNSSNRRRRRTQENEDDEDEDFDDEEEEEDDEAWDDDERNLRKRVDSDEETVYSSKKSASKKRTGAAASEKKSASPVVVGKKKRGRKSKQELALMDEANSKKKQANALNPAEVEAFKKQLEELPLQVDVSSIKAALDVPFNINCVSYQGTFATPPNAGPRLLLEAASKCFVPNTIHYVGDNNETLIIKEMATQRKNHSSSNFIVVKFELASMHLTMKLYSSRYFQLFGASDRENMSAKEACSMLVEFVWRKMQECGSSGTRVGKADEIRLIALSAFHQGLSHHGLGIDLNAFDMALKKCRGYDEDNLMKNTRTGALVLKTGKGSWFFHSKGTVQLFGTKQTPAEATAQLTELFLSFPHCIVKIDPNEKPPKRRRPSKAKVAEIVEDDDDDNEDDDVDMDDDVVVVVDKRSKKARK